MCQQKTNTDSCSASGRCRGAETGLSWKCGKWVAPGRFPDRQPRPTHQGLTGEHMKVLNLYAGIGGNRKKWTDCQVTAVEFDERIARIYLDNNPKDNLVIADAHQYLLDHYQDFDFIWSSPPCQTHSSLARANPRTAKKYPDMTLYQEILFLRHFFKGKWVVENVVPYYEPLIPGLRVGRHMFWSNFDFVCVDIRPSGDIARKSNIAGMLEMQKWLGIEYEKPVYYGNNHCPVQILRNCVHPNMGLQIFEHARQSR